jgi:flagellar basal body rod protein FlgG
MAGGAYAALSGLSTRFAELDRIAADIANVGTAGYKSERGSTVARPRGSFADALNSAVDVVAGPTKIDFSVGTIASTGRDLDVAIEGNGFFVIETETGEQRYTRNGNFKRGDSGVLATEDGLAVLGESGPIELRGSPVRIDSDGTIYAGAEIAGRLQIVDFEDYSVLSREGGARFVADGDVLPDPADEVSLKTFALELSNVSLPEQMVQITQLSRSFGTMQKGLTTIENDMDGRAISELGRR